MATTSEHCINNKQLKSVLRQIVSELDCTGTLATHNDTNVAPNRALKRSIYIIHIVDSCAVNFLVKCCPGSIVLC